jgi:hypothetical protein
MDFIAAAQLAEMFRDTRDNMHAHMEPHLSPYNGFGLFWSLWAVTAV